LQIPHTERLETRNTLASNSSVSFSARLALHLAVDAWQAELSHIRDDYEGSGECAFVPSFSTLYDFRAEDNIETVVCINFVIMQDKREAYLRGMLPVGISFEFS
jgi:hypothetical protein